MDHDPARAKSLFLAAADLADAAQRGAYLDGECAGDAELRSRIEALLRADGAAPLPVDAAATVTSDPREASGPPSRPSSANPSASAAGVVISDRYTLLEKIGEGGMGEVWVARQTEPVKRRVALKLIKQGMDSRSVLTRFEQERQALALMDHPNIARVFDAGVTTSGEPFFVMELVNGLTLTRFCDEARLTPNQRLELFLPICQAVQHAHQKGIVHRDLKPANILVTMIDGRPVPKVIDFGVAKATAGKLTDETLMTHFGAVVGTLEYMSPEQAGYSGDDIDTRSDIYSLGVILYELLTGLRPVDGKRLRKAAMAEMIRMIQEDEPSKPSTRLSTDESLPSLAALRQTDPHRLTALLRGELDCVVMKCLEKQRDRRYETANGLLRDIQRYLADEPVEARPPTAGYRLGKFLRRNRGPVIAATLVVLLLIGGIVGTTLGLFEAQHQTGIAREETKAKGVALRAEAASNDELKHRLGVSEMVLASAAFDNRDVKLAAERLDKVPAAQRGWEWLYLKRQSIGGIFTLAHGGPVTCIAVSPDGSRIATAGGHQQAPFVAKVWDARTGAFLFELKGLPQKIDGINTPDVCIAFSDDSKRIVTCRGDKTARLWDAMTGALQLELVDRTGEATFAAFSPDGARVATGHDGGRIKLWDAKTGAVELELSAHKNAIAHLAFSPDGGRIATTSRDRSVRVWDAKSAALLLDAKGVMRNEGNVAFSPDGKRIVIGGNDDKATVLDATTGAVLLELKGRTVIKQSFAVGGWGVRSAAFSPDGSRIITGGGVNATGEAIVWDARTGAELLELKGHTGFIFSVAFSADGLRVVTGCGDGTAKVWDARTGTPRLELDGVPGTVMSVAISRDGRQLVVCGGLDDVGHAAIWDAHTGEPGITLKGFSGSIKTAAFSPDGSRIITGGGTYEQPGQAIVWDARTGTILFELKGITHPKRGLREGVTSAAFSHDGKLIATGGGDSGENQGNEVKLWDARTGELLHDLTQPNDEGGFMIGTRLALAFNADSTRLLVGGARNMQTIGTEARVWDVNTGASVLAVDSRHEGGMRCVAFTPDGTRFVTGGADSTARVFDAQSGALLLELKGHTGDVNGIAVSPDGTRIITASGDRTVRVWDARTGTTLAELKGHAGPVFSMALSTDGKRIVTGSFMAGSRSPTAAGQVFVWDARTGKELPDEEELAYRRRWTTPLPHRYRERYLAAAVARDESSAAFFLNLVPPAERAALVARADALAFEALTKRAKELHWAGKLDEAQPLLIEVWTTHKSKRGPDDPATLQAINMLARNYSRQGQHEQAIALMEESVKLRKAKFGPDDPQTLQAIVMLGSTLKDAGQLQKAITALEAAGKQDFVQDQLIDLYTRVGEHGKAVDLLLKSLEAVRQSTPAESLAYALPYKLAQVSDAYLAQKKWAEAEPYLREALTLREKAQPDEWTTFQTQSSLGGSLLGQKRYAEAQPLLLKGYEGLKKHESSIPPDQHLLLPKALDRLIELHTAMNNPDEVKKWQAERANYPAAP